MIDNIYEWLRGVGITKGQDKIIHFIAGFVIALVSSLIFGDEVGIIAGCLSAIAKEGYDYYDYGKFDFFDMFVTMLGAVIGVMAFGMVM